MTGSIKSQGLRTTIYKVTDLQAATEWYSKAFGIQPYFEESFYVGFNIGGYELGLLPDESKNTKTANVLTYWDVPDMEQAFQFLQSIGARVHNEPQDVGGGIIVAELLDPWDNVLGIIRNPLFGREAE